MQRLSLQFYEDKQVVYLMSNVVNDTDLFEQFIAHAIPDVVVNLITLVGGTAILLNLNWILGLNPFDACKLDGSGRNNPEYLYFDAYANCPRGICNGISSGLHD